MCSYIDDIIVKSKFQGELIAILRKLLIACRIIINPNKIFSGVSLISYILGEQPMPPPMMTRRLPRMLAEVRLWLGPRQRPGGPLHQWIFAVTNLWRMLLAITIAYL
jgi:hypothetical protein